MSKNCDDGGKIVENCVTSFMDDTYYFYFLIKSDSKANFLLPRFLMSFLEVIFSLWWYYILNKLVLSTELLYGVLLELKD